MNDFKILSWSQQFDKLLPSHSLYKQGISILRVYSGWAGAGDCAKLILRHNFFCCHRIGELFIESI